MRKACLILYTTGGRIISGVVRKEINIHGGSTTEKLTKVTGTIRGINITSAMLKGSEAVALIIGIEAGYRKVSTIIIHTMFIKTSTSIEDSRIRVYWRKRIELDIIIAKEAKILLGTTQDDFLSKNNFSTPFYFY